MTEYILRRQIAPNESNSVRFVPDIMLRPVPNARQVRRSLEGSTAASQQVNIISGVWEYSEEDIAMFDAASEFTPELTERYRAFLQE